MFRRSLSANVLLFFWDEGGAAFYRPWYAGTATKCIDPD